MSGNRGYDATQATFTTTWELTDSFLVIEDGAMYQMTGTLLQSLITSTINPTEKVVTKTGTYTIASGDNIINADTDTAGATQNFNLSAVTDFWDSTNGRSQIVTVKNTGSTYNLVVTPGTETIDGASSITVGPGASAGIYTDGSNFFARGL